jgi:GcrA cell cycle regulator
MNPNPVLPEAAAAGTKRWSDEAVEKLKALHREGISYSAIAKELGHGITRNAVCSKVDRLGLPPRGATGNHNVHRPKRPVGMSSGSRPAKQPQAKLPEPDFGSKVPVLKFGAAFAPLPGSEPRHWEQRGPGQCKWPIDLPDGSIGSCCLQARPDGHCSRHAEISVGGL